MIDPTSEKSEASENEIDDSPEVEIDEPNDDLDDFEDDVPGFDWIVFMLRISAVVTFGATVITAIDVSRNQDQEWLTVMRISILPFVGGMLLLAAAELIDRRED